MDDFGERLRRVRESLGLTQTAVARRAFDPTDPRQENFNQYISKLELGKETNPALDTLERLARGLGLALPDLMMRLSRAGDGTAIPSITDYRRQSVSEGIPDAAVSGASLTAVRHLVAPLRELFVAMAALCAEAAGKLALIEQVTGADPDAPGGGDDPRADR